MSTNWFADFSAGVDGSGTSGSPWNTLVGKTPSAGDKVWLRRAGALVLAANFTFVAGVDYIGWPKGGDPITGIPTAPTGWGSDTNDYAEIQLTDATKVITLSHPFLSNAPSTYTYYRIKINNTSGFSSTSYLVEVDGTSTGANKLTIGNCFFLSKGRTFICSTVELQVDDTIFQCDSALGGGVEFGSNIVSNLGPAAVLNRCTFQDTGASSFSSGTNLVLVSIPVGAQVAFFKCSFTTNGDCCLLGVQMGQGATHSYSIASKLSCVDCTFDDSARAGNLSGAAIQSEGSVIMTNCSYNGKTGVIIGTNSTTVSGKPGQYQFTTFTQTANYSPCIQVLGAGHEVEVHNFSPNGSTATPIDCVSSKLLLVNAAAPSVRAPHIYVKDEGGTVDAWHRIALGGDIRRNTTILRTGGAPYTIKFSFDQDANERRPLIFGEPGRENVQLYLPAGLRTTTYFGCWKGYSNPLLPKEFWFELDYYDSTTAHRSLGSTRKLNNLVADTSTWTGDTGLNPFRVVIQVNVGQGGLAPVRFYMRHYEASGVLYLDPRAKVS